MEELNANELQEMLTSGDLNYYQLYDVDIEPTQYFSITHYINNPNDNIERNQLLNVLFFDIEVYNFNQPDVELDQAKNPVSSNTIYSTFDKTYYVYFLELPCIFGKIDRNKLSQFEEEIKKELIDYKYIKEDDNIKILLYRDELELLKDNWNKIHEIDPSVISGFNADKFDLPYLYRRLRTLTNDENKPQKIMSKFDVVKTRKFGGKLVCQIPEYPLLDIRHLYIPRDEGGLNYGKKLSSYSLDNMSDEILGLKKLNYKDKGLSLDAFYEQDPIGYIKYNIMDVALTARLNEKLDHINLHNLLRRSMSCPISTSLRGVSALFESYFAQELKRENKAMKYGIVTEQATQIDSTAINNIIKPANKKAKWTLDKVDNTKYRKIVSRYPGAYVKDGLGDIVESYDGIHIDMDATSLYPSMQQQYNISFDSYFGRIIDPLCYKTIENFNTIISGNKDILIQIADKLFDQILTYVDNLDPNNKNEYRQSLYFIIMNHIQKLTENSKTFEELQNPSDQNDYLCLKLYLLPLLDLITDINPKSFDVNSFSYEYIINNEFNSDYIYVLENEYSPNIKITKIDSSDFINYMNRNNIGMTISGCFFYQHEYYEGILNKFLRNRLSMRKKYKNARDEYKVGTPEYQFFDSRQLAMKINANSAYGLTGMSGFRFSNKWLAKSTTLSGKLCLKTAQMCGELYLRDVYDKIQNQ